MEVQGILWSMSVWTLLLLIANWNFYSLPLWISIPPFLPPLFLFSLSLSFFFGWYFTCWISNCQRSFNIWLIFSPNFRASAIFLYILCVQIFNFIFLFFCFVLFCFVFIIITGENITPEIIFAALVVFGFNVVIFGWSTFTANG